MQKNNKRTSKLVKDDTRAETYSDVVPQEPLAIISISADNKGNIFGLSNNGKLYKYNFDTRDWVML